MHGGHVTAKDEPAKGFDNWRKAIDALETDVPVLIENTAGGDYSMSRRLERIEGLWAAITTANGGDKVGFTLDTCHAWASGLDLATAVDEIRAITGRIDLVHANDSRDGAGSGADRHINFGKGLIPEELLVGVIAAAGPRSSARPRATWPRTSPGCGSAWADLPAGWICHRAGGACHPAGGACRDHLAGSDAW